MKRYKLEFSLAALFLLFVILLTWETLAAVHHLLPTILMVVCGVFIATLLAPVRKDKKTGSHHEAYAPKYFAQAILSSIVGIAIILCVAVLLNKNDFSKTIDLTANKVNSLSNESTQFLSSLPQQVQIFCIPSSNVEEHYCDTNSHLVSLYARGSKNIIYGGEVRLDNRALLQKIQPSGFARLILLTSNNKAEVEGRISESKFTNALINLVKFKKTVYFLSGSGEPPLTGSGGEKNYSDVSAALQAKAYSVKEWNIRQGDLPADAQVLVAGDNSIAYNAEVESMLVHFVGRGGKLLLINNPYREQGLTHFYEALHLKALPVLLTLNAETPLGRQLSKQQMLRPPVVVSNFSFASPITRVIAQVYGAQAVIPVDGGRPFEILNDSNSAVKTHATVLMSAFSAAPITLTEQQRNKIDLVKPFSLTPDAHFDAMKAWPLGVDVEVEGASHLLSASSVKNANSKDNSEVVLYGFSLVGPYAKAVPISEELIPLTVAHLYQDKELVSIPPRDVGPKHFNLSRNPGAWLPLFAGFLPVVTALIGILIWARRRAA